MHEHLVELVSKELNLHVYLCREFDVIIFTLLIIFIVKKLQKEQNSTNQGQLSTTMTPNLPE